MDGIALPGRDRASHVVRVPRVQEIRGQTGDDLVAGVGARAWVARLATIFHSSQSGKCQRPTGLDLVRVANQIRVRRVDLLPLIRVTVHLLRDLRKRVPGLDRVGASATGST